MRRTLGLGLLVLVVVAGGGSAGAQDSDRIYALWTRSLAMQDDPELASVLEDLEEACEREGGADRVESLFLAECQRWVGESWFRIRRTSEGFDALVSAHERYTSILGPTNPLSGEVLYMIARAALDEGRVDRARRAVGRAIELRPPLDEFDVELCETVFAGDTPDASRCSPSFVGESLGQFPIWMQEPDVEVDALRFGKQPVSGSRSHRGFFQGKVRWGYGIESTDEGDQVWRGRYRQGGLNGYAVWLNLRPDAAGEYYAGGWKNGRRSGFGVALDRNGNLYRGEFVENRRSGRGELRLRAEGAAYYHGEFESDALEGEGTLVYPGVFRYVGSWSKGNRVGQGSLEIADGILEYRGEFANDRPAGEGQIFVEGRLVYAGEVDPERGPGFGQFDLASDGFYFGELHDGRPHGFGLAMRTGGAFVTGLWVDGRHVRSWTEDDLAAAR